MLLICILASVAALAYYVMTILFGSDNTKLRSRLEGKVSNEPTVAKPTSAGGVKTLMKQMGEAASKPFMPNSREKQSQLQHELGRAGIYSPAAVRAVQGAKLISLSMGLVLGYVLSLFFSPARLCRGRGGWFGDIVRLIWRRLKVSSNQKLLNYALPDALDLMVVCVEAGLTIDAAMQRVGEELAMVHPALSREFGITQMQTRVGLPRGEALKNMGTRTTNQGLMSLSAMLNQADRFGTSIAQALRIHAESMRVARQHKAEEMAAKSTVKMSFPLVFFIFPATFIVLMGPVIIQLFDSPLMKQ